MGVLYLLCFKVHHEGNCNDHNEYTPYHNNLDDAMRQCKATRDIEVNFSFTPVSLSVLDLSISPYLAICPKRHITLHLIQGTKRYNAVDDILHILCTVLSAMSLYSINQKKLSL